MNEVCQNVGTPHFLSYNAIPFLCISKLSKSMSLKVGNYFSLGKNIFLVRNKKNCVAENLLLCTGTSFSVRKRKTPLSILVFTLHRRYLTHSLIVNNECEVLRLTLHNTSH